MGISCLSLRAIAWQSLRQVVNYLFQFQSTFFAIVGLVTNNHSWVVKGGIFQFNFVFIPCSLHLQPSKKRVVKGGVFTIQFNLNMGIYGY